MNLNTKGLASNVLNMHSDIFFIYRKNLHQIIPLFKR